MSSPSAPSTLVVWNRDPTSADSIGRMHILRGVRAAVAERGPFREMTAPSVFARRGRKRGFLRFTAVLLAGLLRFRPLPLQCGLFSEAQAMLDEMGALTEDTVLLDSVRHLVLLEALRAKHPGLRVILDMDDLMSRRVDQLLRNEFDVSLGLFSDQMPAAFAKLLENRTFARLLLRYERMALRVAERRVCALSDVVVMVSEVEAEMLHTQAGPGRRAEIRAIAPPTALPESVVSFAADDRHGPLRFAFIGTDKLIQNRSAIDWLIDLWRREHPKAQLVIFGKQSRNYADLPSNVIVHGFVDSIDEVYDGRTVLFTPTFLAGGVKTKFLEAFSYGAPVLGTRLTYEGVPADPAFLATEDLDLGAVLSDPEAFRPRFAEAAARGQAIVRERYGRPAFLDHWASVLAGRPMS